MKTEYLKSIFIFFICIFMFCSTIFAQTNKTFFLGHSLVNFDIPNMVDKLSIANSQQFEYDANIGIGATLSWHFMSPTSGQGDQWDLTLPLGGYENFILTEAVPLENHLEFSDTYRITDRLCSFANEYNPNIQYYIYETWHCTNSGNGTTSGEGGFPCSWDSNSNILWRDRIDFDLVRWESIADSINLIHEKPMLVIPGGQALGRLHDHILSTGIPGLSSVFDLFLDEYHLDGRGNYFIACVMYSVIHGESPVGLPNQLTNQFGNLYTVYPTTEQAIIMQELAWNTVCDYERSGVACESVAISPTVKEKSTLNVYPVPAIDFITVNHESFTKSCPFTIYDQGGKIIQKGSLSSKTTVVDVINLPPGLYFLSTKSQAIKFIKTE